jgi:hypothetical protein
LTAVSRVLASLANNANTAFARKEQHT